MRLAIDKAKTFGVGIVTVRNSGHFGAAANYSMMALEHGMLGLATTNSSYVAMVPTFGREPKLSTNPISFAAPAGRHAPFVLDMATTTVPDIAMKKRFMSPLGGSRELGGHKGYGLGMMEDILSGVLPGATYGDLFQRA